MKQIIFLSLLFSLAAAEGLIVSIISFQPHNPL